MEEVKCSWRGRCTTNTAARKKVIGEDGSKHVSTWGSLILLFGTGLHSCSLV
jgi:hypothetical protein